MRTFSFDRATGMEDAIRRWAESPQTAFVAGGTTLIDLVKLEVMRPDHVVDVNRVGLDRIETQRDGRMRIGAIVRNSDLAWHQDVRARYPVLAEALLSGASAQIRNMATTGGNLMQRTRCVYFRDNVSACNKREPGAGCAAMDGWNRMHAVLGTSDRCIATHPSDMCVALAALEAEIVLAGRDGERTVPLMEFHLLPGETPQNEHALRPGELITAVILPALPRGARSWYVKLRDRMSYEFALASAAVVLALDGDRIIEARVALGGVATKPWRSREAENELTGKRAEEAAFRRAAEAAMAGAKPRKYNAFKVELGQRAIMRALTMVAEGQPEVRKV